MSDKPTLEQLREKARVNYGITNADDLDEKRLKEEMAAIDKQAKAAEKEQADITRNPDRAASNSTTNPLNGASDGNATSTGDEGESDEEDEAKPLNKQTKPELLETAKAEGVEVEDGDTVPVLREKIQAERDAASEDDDEDEDEDEEETPEELSKLSREDLESRAREAGVEGDPSDKEQYPDHDALVTAIEAARTSR